MEENEGLSNAQESIQAQFLENNVSFWMPSRRNALFEIEIKSNAAVKIQSTWRGYQARQLYNIAKSSQKKENAVIVIQHAVRRWLYGKGQHSISSMWERLPPDKRTKIQGKLESIRKNKELCKKCKDTPVDAYEEVQHRLNIWYAKAPEREMDFRKIESLCSHLEATSLVMQDSRGISDFEDSDMDFYHCPSVTLAAEARLDFKQKIQIMFAPWWKKINVKPQNEWEKN